MSRCQTSQTSDNRDAYWDRSARKSVLPRFQFVTASFFNPMWISQVAVRAMHWPTRMIRLSGFILNLHSLFESNVRQCHVVLFYIQISQVSESLSVLRSFFPVDLRSQSENSTEPRFGLFCFSFDNQRTSNIAQCFSGLLLSAPVSFFCRESAACMLLSDSVYRSNDARTSPRMLST